MTAGEIREKIIDAVSRNGGHLASSLGAVELAMALAETFDPVEDRIVWDVGHQAYAWKILTGRGGAFGTLRTFGGLSGFPLPSESPADAAVGGHAGVALSVAEGYAAARDLSGANRHVVAVTGDSSLVNGTCFEAMNNLAAATGKIIFVLNDNGMSISKPAGSFSRFLGRLISGVGYNRAKSAAERAGHALKLSFLSNFYHGIETRVKSLFLGNIYFERFGLRYIGPVDGHDLKALKEALSVAKDDKRSVIVHVVTKKGKGFRPAEEDPTRWHGTGPFDRNDPGTAASGSGGWSEAAGRAICALAQKDSRVVALTAGMKDGTGLDGFARAYPSRFFDVGIAEGHLVSFAAGLAAGGYRPFVAVYSKFLQRAIDQVMHDVAIASLPVVFCIDRAGVVGRDGVTHQGLYDYAMLKTIPGLAIYEPKDAEDLEKTMKEALESGRPAAIRYPRGSAPARLDCPAPRIEKGGVAIWSGGSWLAKAMEVASRTGAGVVYARSLKPYDSALLEKQRAAGMKIVSIENGALAGGFGETISADVRFGWPDRFIPHGSPEELEKAFGLDVDSIVARLSAQGAGKGNP